jgi:hypothetical protein
VVWEGRSREAPPYPYPFPQGFVRSFAGKRTVWTVVIVEVLPFSELLLEMDVTLEGK